MSILGEGYINTGVFNRVFSDRWVDKKSGMAYHPLLVNFMHIGTAVETNEAELRKEISDIILKAAEPYYSEINSRNQTKRFLGNKASNLPSFEKTPINYIDKIIPGLSTSTGGLPENNVLQKSDNAALKPKENPSVAKLRGGVQSYVRFMEMNAEANTYIIEYSGIKSPDDKVEFAKKHSRKFLGPTFLEIARLKENKSYSEKEHRSKFFEVSQQLFEAGIIPETKIFFEAIEKNKNAMDAFFKLCLIMKDAGSITPDNCEIKKASDGTVTEIKFKGTDIVFDKARCDTLKISHIEECLHMLENNVNIKAIDGLFAYGSENFQDTPINELASQGSFKDAVGYLMDHVKGVYHFIKEELNIYGNNIPNYTEIRSACTLAPLKSSIQKLNEKNSPMEQLEAAIDIVYKYNKDETDDIIRIVAFLKMVKNHNCDHDFMCLDTVKNENKIAFSGTDDKILEFDYRTIKNVFTEFNKKFREMAMSVQASGSAINALKLADEVEKISYMLQDRLTQRYANDYSYAYHYLDSADEDNFIKHRKMKGAEELIFEFNEDKIVSSIAESRKIHKYNSQYTIEVEAGYKKQYLAYGLKDRFDKCPYANSMRVTIDPEQRVIVRNPVPELMKAYNGEILIKELTHDEELKGVVGALNTMSKYMPGLSITTPSENDDGYSCNFKVLFTKPYLPVDEENIKNLFAALKVFLKETLGESTAKLTNRKYIEINDFPSDRIQSFMKLMGLQEQEHIVTDKKLQTLQENESDKIAFSLKLISGYTKGLRVSNPDINKSTCNFRLVFANQCSPADQKEISSAFNILKNSFKETMNGATANLKKQYIEVSKFPVDNLQIIRDAVKANEQAAQKG